MYCPDRTKEGDPVIDTDVRRPPAGGVIEGAGIRAQLAPFGALGVLVVAAGAVRVAVASSGHETAAASGTTAVCFTIAVVAAWAARRRFVDRKDRANVWAWLTLSASWISWAAANGLDLGAFKLLALATAGLSLLWWRIHRIPNAAAAVKGRPRPFVDHYVDRWAAHLGGTGDLLAGSKLRQPQAIKAGLRYRLDLVPGRQHLGQVLADLEKIRGGLRLLDDHEIIVERHPSEPAPTVQVTIVTRSPIRQVVHWPGPKAAYDRGTGMINLGPFADGEGFAPWRLFTQDSMWGGFICGGTGSGKSRTIESICMAAASVGVVTWFADGQNGASSKLLKRKADHFAGTSAEWLAMLDQARDIMMIRQDENDALDLDGFTHTPKRPGLLIVIDECHKVFADPGNQKKAATIAREGRKVGVALLAASQVNDLGAFGTGPEGEALRSSLLMGNGVIMRTKANSAKGIFNVDIDPRNFPKIPGYGFLVDPEDRSAPYRGWFVNDETAAKWADHIRWAALDAVAGGAAGPDYLERHVRREAARAARMARVQAARSGRLHQHVSRTAPAVAPEYPVMAFPVWDPSKFRPASPVASPGHQAVARALAQGRGLVAGQRYCRPGTMAAEVQLTERRVHTILKDLAAHGVVRAGETQGHYYPTGKQLVSQVA
jgi:hypothetical protein